MPPPSSSPDFYGFSESDRTIFQEMVAWFKRRFLSPNPLSSVDPPKDGPWNSVVLVPPGGIRAMWDRVGRGYTGTGTYLNESQGTGTGTAVGEEGDRPGYADCPEFKLETATPGDPGRYLVNPRMLKTGRTLRVYNLANVEVCGNQFVTVNVDRYGVWWVSWPGLLFEEAP